ncbi:hypothetical protein VQ071_11910 [Cohnella sp. 56]|uniref:hypothetical protein n=1 Tax=Cohnella sp. 56 TaxID=3113722 RepID=UPI0030E94E03
MFDHPLAWFYLIVRDRFRLCNGAGKRTFLVPAHLAAQGPHRGFDFPQHRFRHIADCRAQMRKGGQGIEIPDLGQVVATDIVGRLLAAAGHHHIGDSLLRSFPEQQLDMQDIQLFEQAVVALGEQQTHIIGAVILHRVPRRGQQRGGQFHARLPFVAEGVLQRFKHGLRIRLVHAPERHGARLAALRIRNVKHMAQSQAAAPILN